MTKQTESGKINFIISFIIITLVIFFIPVSFAGVLLTLVSSVILGRIFDLGKFSFLIIFPLLLFLFFEAYLIIYSLGFKNSTEGIKGNETVIVLGGAVTENGPMPHTAERLNAAFSLWQKYPDLKVIVSGAQGKFEPDTEATIMKKYLVSKGMPEEAIYDEYKARDTIENIIFSKELASREGLNPQYIIVSSEYHLLRAGIIAGFEGINYRLYAGFTRGFRPDYYLREFLSTIKVYMTYWFSMKDILSRDNF